MNEEEWEELNEWMSSSAYWTSKNEKYDENGMFTYNYHRQQEAVWEETLEYIARL